MDHFAIEMESEEYAASEFKMNDLMVKFRLAKTTPTKTGQFITMLMKTTSRPLQC